MAMTISRERSLDLIDPYVIDIKIDMNISYDENFSIPQYDPRTVSFKYLAKLSNGGEVEVTRAIAHRMHQAIMQPRKPRISEFMYYHFGIHLSDWSTIAPFEIHKEEEIMTKVEDQILEAECRKNARTLSNVDAYIVLVCGNKDLTGAKHRYRTDIQSLEEGEMVVVKLSRVEEFSVGYVAELLRDERPDSNENIDWIVDTVSDAYYNRQVESEENLVKAFIGARKKKAHSAELRELLEDDDLGGIVEEYLSNEKAMEFVDVDDEETAYARYDACIPGRDE